MWKIVWEIFFLFCINKLKVIRMLTQSVKAERRKAENMQIYCSLALQFIETN